MRRLVLVLVAALAVACKSDRSAATSARPSGSTPPAEPTPRPAVESLDPPAGADAMGANLSVSGDDVLATWLEPVADA